MVKNWGNGNSPYAWQWLQVKQVTLRAFKYVC
jgi:hypothetical protein